MGGRGKAGGIVRVESGAGLREALGRLAGSRIRGHRVHECRLEQPVRGQECYISLMLDAQSGEVIVLMSAQGGVDIEQHAGADNLLRQACAFDLQAVRQVATAMVAQLPDFARRALAEAAGRLTDAFFSLELTLAEINPLFVLPDGTWMAGDAKLVADDNAIERQPALMQLLRERGHAYPEASLKIDHGFDFVRLDEEGDVGMLTTGAGLSMQLVDELTRRGCRPFNFVDIRTGQFRGSPDRLIQASGDDHRDPGKAQAGGAHDGPTAEGRGSGREATPVARCLRRRRGPSQGGRDESGIGLGHAAAIMGGWFASGIPWPGSSARPSRRRNPISAPRPTGLPAMASP